MTEPDSFTKVILPHLDHLHSRARSMIRDRSRTGDLVLKTLIRARKRYRRGANGENLRPWLTNIMDTVWTQEFRNSGDRTESAHSPEPSANRSSTAESDPREKSEGVEADRFQFEDVRKVLMSIPAKYRRILVLALSEELDEKEIADTLELHPATVRMRYARGKRLLKAKLENREDQLEPFRRSWDLDG